MTFAQEYEGKRLVVRSANYMYSGTLKSIETLTGNPTNSTEPKFLVLSDPTIIFDIDEQEQKVLNEEQKKLPNPLFLAVDTIERIYPTTNSDL